jgi:hypothetical protein
MILAYLLLLTGLTISAVAIYYSVVGLTAIFSAAAIPIIIMGSALEVGKLVSSSSIHAILHDYCGMCTNANHFNGYFWILIQSTQRPKLSVW